MNATKQLCTARLMRGERERQKKLLIFPTNTINVFYYAPAFPFHREYAMEIIFIVSSIVNGIKYKM